MKSLLDQGVILEGMILKPSMVIPGKESGQEMKPEEVAYYTVRTYGRTLVSSVPGISFLSGGQSEEEATMNLNAINSIEGMPKPWALTFSFGRALQASCLKAWQGKPENVTKAQATFLKRAKANSEASVGDYNPKTVDAEATADLHVKNYIY